jgi:hypothetical protein
MITLDTFALLRSIAAASKTFEAVEPDLEKAGVAAVKKSLKAKNLTIEQLREITRAIGADALGFVAGHDSMKDSDIKGIVKQVDKYWPAVKSARIDEQRTHLLALAQGARQPSEKLVAVRPATKRPAAKPKAASWSKSMSAKASK